MKQLKDYKDTLTLVKFDTVEQYQQLVPLLNKVFHAWNIHSGSNYMNSKYNCIDMYRDQVCRISDCDRDKYTIVLASEFLCKKEEIITDYNIY